LAKTGVVLEAHWLSVVSEKWAYEKWRCLRMGTQNRSQARGSKNEPWT